jgi:cytochrome P450
MAQVTLRRTPPGPPGLPIFGSLLASLRDPLGYPLRNFRRYGDVVSLHNWILRGVALYGADANRYILVDAADKFLVEPLFERLGVRWITGDGLLFIDDPQHRRQRRLMMPAFHRKRIESYAATMRAATAQVLDSWTPGAEIDVSKEMHRLALTIAGRCLFSVDLSAGASDLGRAVAAFLHSVGTPWHATLARLPFDIPGVSSGATFRRAQARLNRVLNGIIAEHEREGTDTGDVVSMLVAARDEDGSRLSPQQIRDQLLTLFMAGHETTANALSWACYLLAQHPAVTRKLLAELDRQLGGRDPLPADLERLPYLDWVVKEVLRIYPPAASALRVARDSFTWKGYQVPAGSVVIYSPYITHRMPQYYPAPHAFRPERFDPAGHPPPPYAYIPFGSGPRTCIGMSFATMEMKTALPMILQRYRLALVPGQRVDATLHVTIQPRYGVRMRVHAQDRRPERSPARVRGNAVGATHGLR